MGLRGPECEYTVGQAERVIKLLAAGVSYRQTAVRCSMSLGMVQRIVALYRETGVVPGTLQPSASRAGI